MRLRFKPVTAVVIAVIISGSVLLAPSFVTSGSHGSAVAVAAASAPEFTHARFLAARRSQASQASLHALAHYTVRRGDTLTSIAARYLHGSWRGLYCANRRVIGPSPDRISSGMRLELRTEAGCRLPASPRLRAAPRHASFTRTAAAYRGIYSFSALEALWVSAGGPRWAAWPAATIAECESGGNPRAYNPSGASGLFQILGDPFPGDPFDPYTNARMAVYKFRESGSTFAQWVCRA